MSKSIQAFSSPSMLRIVPSTPFFGKWPPSNGILHCSSKRPHNIVLASRRDAFENKGGLNGKMVDENMIVLRMRIHEMKAEDQCINGEQRMLGWMEWEKRYYGSYDYGSDICEGIGLLQRLLMETRPSLALAMAALVVVSVPMFTGILVWNLIIVLAGL